MGALRKSRYSFFQNTPSSQVVLCLSVSSLSVSHRASANLTTLLHDGTRATSVHQRSCLIQAMADWRTKVSAQSVCSFF